MGYYDFSKGVTSATPNAMVGSTEEPRTGIVQFYTGRVYMPDWVRQERLREGTLEADAPDYYETPFIRIKFPGDKLTQIDRQVRMEGDDEYPSDPDMYPAQWARFQAQEEGDIGTPLSVLTELNKGDITQLEKAGILDVETLASVADHHLNGVGLGSRRMRDFARRYLDAQPRDVHDAAAAQKIESLEEQVARLTALLEGQVANKRREPAKQD